MAFGASMRDRAVVAIGIVVAMYLAAGALWYLALTDKASSWNSSQRQYKTSLTKFQQERKLISQRLMWIDAYDEEREKMPTFPEGEAVDTHWLSKMDAIAFENHVSIGTRQPGQENTQGDVFELPLDVKNWEAGLEPLVKFLYGLEHAQEAMFDVQSLVMRPSSHKGFLKGQFTLTCAYMRGDVEDSRPAAGNAPKQKEKAK